MRKTEKKLLLLLPFYDSQASIGSTGCYLHVLLNDNKILPHSIPSSLAKAVSITLARDRTSRSFAKGIILVSLSYFLSYFVFLLTENMRENIWLLMRSLLVKDANQRMVYLWIQPKLRIVPRTNFWIFSQLTFVLFNAALTLSYKYLDMPTLSGNILIKKDICRVIEWGLNSK